ncbi:putative dehydrogenase [Algoriphagus ratkowskyi]|uniref:Gfo/Idh/MocA family oxidoreductase n=1 Tax=Algoriphagus ratkowskyi TaxID=57028 RepID=A0A2W7QNX0_9BACT|nr:Gfo/Idh/MocA family oxidoreductase [Algoriphagus ratkowskyi]PZX49681.1 putative dehydrogenase [Algoriphagus ratkowskyi]TXD75446.1 Gfo/Idh/MocA family oxidoreductase [Algoriphagus ratkowskyi]
MTKIALIGAGKMGLSHLSILGAHPNVEIVGVCDTTKMVVDVLERYSGYKCFSDYLKMVEITKPDAVFVAVPTKHHFIMVKELLLRGIHVFAEKPFCLNPMESNELTILAKKTGLVNQVGYHNKFVGTFREVKSLIENNSIGEITHFLGEAYGPVVIKKKSENWRSDPSEGGGCLMDYASHVIDLINDLISPINSCKGSILKSIYSKNVDDSVYALVGTELGVSGVISVNWSDETYRKMSTSITIIGTEGKIESDANELKVYYKGDKFPKGYSKGWNVKYVTDLTEEVDFYLRGEEYSAQIDYFIKSVAGETKNNINSFESAWKTDKSISLIKNQSSL